MNECEKCGGTGEVYYMIDCGKPMSVCCGACCTDPEPCPKCLGEGII